MTLPSITRSVLLGSVSAALVLTATGCTRSLVATREAGDRAYREGRYEDALAQYQEYLDRNPGRPEVHHMLGRTYLSMGEPAKAVQQLQIAYAMRVEDDEIFRSLAEALFADKQLDELNQLLRSRTIDRGRMEDYLLLADYANRQGDVDTARTALTTAARVTHGLRIEPHLELAKLYAAVGDRQRAVSRLRMAYFVDPQNGEVLGLARQMGEIVGPTWGLEPRELRGEEPD